MINNLACCYIINCETKLRDQFFKVYSRTNIKQKRASYDDTQKVGKVPQQSDNFVDKIKDLDPYKTKTALKTICYNTNGRLQLVEKKTPDYRRLPQMSSQKPKLFKKPFLPPI